MEANTLLGPENACEGPTEASVLDREPEVERWR